MVPGSYSLPRLSVAVLLGGPSPEREISLKSGQAVAKALSGRGHACTLLDPVAIDCGGYDWSVVDVAFNALHGEFGEDGQVQQILDDAGVPYTGSGVGASQLAFQKSAAKERWLQCSVPTPPYVLIHETDSAEVILQQARHLGFPLVVKPDSQGSSLGVTLVRSPGDLPQALTRCFALGPFGLLEMAVLGSEWTVGLIDQRTLPLIQIATPRDMFDFDAKYVDDTTEYRFDVAAPASVLRGIETIASHACATLGTCGLARVDLRLDRFDRPWVLEVNTVPGLTDHSLVPKAAQRLGLSFADLCEETLAAALRKQSRSLRPAA